MLRSVARLGRVATENARVAAEQCEFLLNTRTNKVGVYDGS